LFIGNAIEELLDTGVVLLVFGSTIENNSLSIGSGFDRRQHSVQFRFRDQFPSKHYRIDLLIIGDVAKGVASSKIDY
jgi:hypothetical protein